MNGLILPLTILSLSVSPLPAGEREADVVGIPDCDQIRIKLGSQELLVRIRGVDCPEKGQEFFKISKRFTTLLVQHQRIALSAMDTAQGGRITAKIGLQGGGDLGSALVRNGMAWWDRRADPGDSVLARMEKLARDHFFGLWGEANPVAPWDWRARPGAVDDCVRPARREGDPGPGAAPDGAAALEIVFQSTTGGGYHRSGCPRLHDPAATTVGDAWAAGLSPCPICFPAARQHAKADSLPLGPIIGSTSPVPAFE